MRSPLVIAALAASLIAPFALATATYTRSGVTTWTWEDPAQWDCTVPTTVSLEIFVEATGYRVMVHRYDGPCLFAPDEYTTCSGSIATTLLCTHPEDQCGNLLRLDAGHWYREDMSFYTDCSADGYLSGYLY